MKISRTHRAGFAALAASLAVAACGGGGSDNSDRRAVDRAGANSQGFLEFIASFAGRDFDNDEPYDLSEFEAPSDDADSAAPVSTPVDG